MSETCATCGADLSDMNITLKDQHEVWCQGVEQIVERAMDGERVRPQQGTQHQLSEAINRLSRIGFQTSEK